PSVAGEPVIISFTVTTNAPGAGTPTGNVTASDGTQSCSATVAAAQCTIAFATAGPHTITVSYAGDVNFAGSTAAGVTHTVKKANTVTSISSHSASVVGQPSIVAFTVAPVSPGAGTPTGTVTIQSSTGETCSATVTAGQCTLTFSSAADHTLTVTYAGDGNFNGSASAAVTHTVARANSAI